MSGTEQTAQALGGPGGQLGGQTPQAQMMAKFKSVVTGVQEVFQVFQSIPGADQQKVQQARQLMEQAVQLLAASVQKPGGGGAAMSGGAPGMSPGAASGASPPPGMPR